MVIFFVGDGYLTKGLKKILSIKDYIENENSILMENITA
jgi:hypothetical protein